MHDLIVESKGKTRRWQVLDPSPSASVCACGMGVRAFPSRRQFTDHRAICPGA